jgi:hypothetical protein
MRQEQKSRFGVVGFSAFALMGAMLPAQAGEPGASSSEVHGQGLKWPSDDGGPTRSGLSMQLAQATQSTQPPPTPVGQAPERDNRPPEYAPIFEQPGVLTPKGAFVFEPSLQYSYSSSNRVALVGYTIIPAILIGVIDIREVKRDTWTLNLTGRYGITNRLEVEMRVPYVYRDDTSVGREILQGSVAPAVFDTDSNGIGDVELTARYQFNDGGLDRAYYIGTLRYKSRTGRDPFESEISNITVGARSGLQTELPLGSGFNAIQPAITMLYPTDPAVFFGTLSYLYNFKRSNVSQSTDQGDIFVGDVKQDGIWGFNFGMGLAINEVSSFSLGYEHSSVGKTKVNGQTVPGSVRVQLGTLLLGYSYRLNDKRSLNVSLGAGLTEDTPDVTLTVRVPMTF